MIKKSMRIWLTIAMSLCAITVVKSAVVIKGDTNAASGETFSFAVQEHVQSSAIGLIGSNVYVAAAPAAGGAEAVKDFSIARLHRESSSFIPLTPEKSVVNGSKDQVVNPLFDKGIAHMRLFNGEGSIFTGSDERPVVVLSSDLKTIYMLNTSSSDGKNSLVISAQNPSISAFSENIPDAAAAITAGILKLEAIQPFVFAIVKPNTGSFGDTGSGVVVCQVGSIELESSSFTGLLAFDGPTFSLSRAGGNRAIALDTTSSALKITSDLASMTEVVDMHWFPEVKRLYISLQITAGAGGTDGGRAIVVGRLTSKTEETTTDKGDKHSNTVFTGLVFDQIAPDAAFDDTKKIVGAVGSSESISMHIIRSMVTSTGLPYLVGVGGVGASAATASTVFAVPVVTGNNTVALNGTIANKMTTPTNHFGKNDIFVGRSIATAATLPAEMPLSSDAATMVGGGDLANGVITDLYVQSDTVFVTVQDPTGTETSGVFYSQALFDADGKIKSWTNWKHAAGTVDKVLGAELDPVTARTTYLAANSSDEIKIVKRTEFSAGDAAGLQPITDAAAELFNTANGGVQGVFNFVFGAPALPTASLAILTGNKGVIIAQTSALSGGVATPTRGTSLGSPELFTAGEITKTFPVGSNNIVSITGGVLDDLGPIVAAEVVRDGTAGSNGYLVVGGVGGAAILSKSDGSGWSAATELSAGLTGLTAGMAFKKFGDYSFVRKIINDGQYLYILTNTQLDRIDLTVGNPGSGTITPITIATAQDLIGSDGSFLDMVVSAKLGLLATSEGLLRTNDGFDIQTIANGANAWRVVPTPEGAGPVRQLIGFAKKGRSQNVSRDTEGGMVYALSAYRGYNQAKLFRYAITSTSTTSVASQTVQQLDDLFIKDMPAYFANYGEFRTLFGTDGSLFFGARSKVLEDDPVLIVLFTRAGLRTGSNRFLSSKLIPVSLNKASIISGLILSSATGSWMMGTDDGLRIQE